MNNLTLSLLVAIVLGACTTLSDNVLRPMHLQVVLITSGCTTFGMRKSIAAILTLLIISALFSPGEARAVHGGDETLEDAMEHQRILEELEEVHQLRERMLQEGELHIAHARDQIFSEATSCYRLS